MNKFVFVLLVACLVCVADTYVLTGSKALSGSKIQAVGALTAPGKAGTPSPANGATHQAISGVTISWSSGVGAVSYDVWVGYSSGSMTKVSATQVGTAYSVTNTTYSQNVVWRIDPINGIGTTTGDEWSYATIVPANAQLLLTMEAGTVGDLLDTNFLNSATSSITNLGYWTVSDNGKLALQVSNVQQTLYTPVSIGGTNYTGTGSRSMQVYSWTNTATADFHFTTNQTKIAWRCYVSFGEIYDASAGQLDHIDIWGTGGQFCVCQLYSGSNPVAIHAHSAKTPSGSLTGPNRSITTGTMYEVRMRYQTNSACEMKILSAADSTLIATSTIGISDGIASDQSFSFIQIGMASNHGLTRENLGITQYDNFVLAIGSDADALYNLEP